jgi:hypothetical protein
LYAIAAIPPTRLRFFLIPVVFGAWFLLRAQDFPLLRRLARLIPGLFRRKTPNR